MTRTALAAAVAVTTFSLSSHVAFAQRAVGIDVSSFQGSINWATVAAETTAGGGGIDFAFIRASRGRTAGMTSPNEDTRFDFNIANAKANSVLAGAYHYARYDLNDALSEANDFLAVARTSMRPGYLRPVLDMEEDSDLTAAETTAWAQTFSDRILAVTGVRPIIYCNVDYATNHLTSSINTHDLWLARYYYTNAQGRTEAERIVFNNRAQTEQPPSVSGYPSVYGVWKTTGTSPWDFWQYTDGDFIPGITTGSVDRDVANGGIEFVKDFVVPAVWTNTAGGTFGLDNMWNNFDGTTTAGVFPDANTRATISLPSHNPTINYNGINRIVRSLQSDEAMNFASGTLTGVQYLNFTASVAVGGAATSGFTAPTISNAGALTMTGGTVLASGATGSITGSGSITVGGTAALSAVTLTQASLTVTGGAATITGAVTTTGAVNVTGGTLNLGSVSTANALAVTGTGRANFTGTGGSKVAGLAATAGTAGGAVNLSLADLAIDYGNAVTASTPATAVRTAIGDGKFVSNKSIAGTTGVGYAEATKVFSGFTSGTRTWNGVSVDTTAMLVSLALFGDTDLNNTVNLADLTTLAASYLQAGNWQNGDSTYDGLVNQLDLDRLGANYGKVLQADGTVTGGNAAQFALDVKLFANLPEPVSLAAVGLAGVVMRRRRRAM